MRQFRSAALVALTTLVSTLTVACGDDDDGTGPGSDIVGTYTLRSVNGQSLPAVEFEDEFVREEIVSSTLTMNAGNSFTVSLTFRETDKETGETTTFPPIEESGTYTLNGSQLTFSSSGDTTNATFTGGNTITISDTDAGETFTWVYRK